MSRVPKILHYTFGMASDFGGKPWSLVHYACLKSAVERITPDQVFLYYEFEPSGPWWELSRELITPVRIEAPREIFGRPLAHVAHRSDVVRLQKLIEHGGIYLDADVLVQRGFDDLLNHQTVLGQEGIDAQMGLANAVILAEPHSQFLLRWLEEYRSFRWDVAVRETWNEHSVKLPARLAHAHPSEITVLPHTAFYWPLWIKEHLDWIFASNKPICLGQAYANHLWENLAWERYLEDLTPRRVRSVDTNFNLWARPLIDGLPDSLGAPNLRRRLRKYRTLTLNKARGFKHRVKRLITR
jgi:Glycosyltransferase sugar-binding region containing DXD motif